MGGVFKHMGGMFDMGDVFKSVLVKTGGVGGVVGDVLRVVMFERRVVFV